MGEVLNNIGSIYSALGDYLKSLDYHERSLEISKEIGDRHGEGLTLNNIGLIYSALGEYSKAFSFYEQSLMISEEIGNRYNESVTLNNIGLTYRELGEFQNALNFFEQSLAFSEKIGNPRLVGASLNNIGSSYSALNQYSKALDFYKRFLMISEEIGDRRSEGLALNNIGYIYENLEEYSKALGYYERSLAISEEIGDQSSRGKIFWNVGHTLSEQNKPELAIIFLKLSVNIFESIRGDLVTLDQSLQASYTDTVSDTYRHLADLLLQQNRILEAQAVLDLLKVQELDDALNDVQRSGNTQGVGYWQIEDDLLQLYTQVLLEGQELAQLQDPANQPRSEEDEARRNQLQTRERELRTTFSGWLDHPEVKALLKDLQTTTEDQTIDLADEYRKLQNELRWHPQASASIYPLFLDERLELVLITPIAPPLRYPVAVTDDELTQTVVDYGQVLKSPTRPAEPLAQKLYGWLIEPMAEDLEKAGIDTLIYAPDGVLRYVPLAALHDGQQWLAQRYSTSHITARSLTGFTAQPQNQNRVLAGACADCDYSFSVGERAFNFADLPATAAEVSILQEQIPETDILLNQDFSPVTLQNELNSYTIFHLATHAAFVPEQPDESFIVFGNGERVTLETIRRDWYLSNADLVVLSACETAVGNTELGTGIEILGMGYQLQTAGAKAALASLWQVNDGGTQILMNAFYAALTSGMTKAEALKAAQSAMIADDYRAVGGERATIDVVDAMTNEPIVVQQDMSHPYYWAPFILIGNGL